MDFGDDFDLQDFDFSLDFGIDSFERSSSSLGQTTSDSDLNTEKELSIQSARKRIRSTDKKDLGKNGGVYFNYRKNGRLVPHVILPKILKQDIRRSYPAMFTNIYNSCDEGLMHKYLETFYRSDFVMHQRFSPSKKAMLGKQDGELIGLPAVSEFWWNKMTISPDVHFALKEAQVKARSDGTGVVQFNYSLSSTVLVPAEGSPQGDQSESSYCTVTKLPGEYAGSVVPMHFQLDGVITMHLDADNRIYSSYFDCY